MPAPKKPNPGPGSAAASLAAFKRRLTKAAELLREAGWTVTPPSAKE